MTNIDALQRFSAEAGPTILDGWRNRWPPMRQTKEA